MGIKFTVIKKNQILASAVTLMLVTAGYLNYKYDPNKLYDVEVTGIIEENLGDAVLVDSKGNVKNFFLSGETGENKYGDSIDDAVAVFQNNTSLSNIISNEKDENVQPIEMLKNNDNENENKEQKVFKEIEDYFISTRIDRTNQYAQQIENYENILLGENTSESQKNKSQEEIEKINAIRTSIMIAENLIRLKGFEETVILVNENSINVVVATDNLSSSEVAQIQNIILNEFQTELENIHIIQYE